MVYLRANFSEPKRCDIVWIYIFICMSLLLDEKVVSGLGFFFFFCMLHPYRCVLYLCTNVNFSHNFLDSEF